MQMVQVLLSAQLFFFFFVLIFFVLFLCFLKSYFPIWLVFLSRGFWSDNRISSSGYITLAYSSTVHALYIEI